MSMDVSIAGPPTRARRCWARVGAAVAWAGMVVASAGAGGDEADLAAARIDSTADRVGREVAAWFRRTPPLERVSWAGLAGCAALAGLVLLDRMVRVRRSRVVPAAFVERFQKRLDGGRLDPGKALDYCELNPSPAARVALAAIRRWGRPLADLERGVALALRVEVDRLRRGVDTLRRVVALAPLVGLLGSLAATGQSLRYVGSGPAWGSAVAEALGPLTAGVALAILAVLAFDGLSGRIEDLAGALDRIGAETIDAITAAVAAPTPAPAEPPRAAHAATEAQPAVQPPHFRRGPRPAPRGSDRESPPKPHGPRPGDRGTIRGDARGS